jgi:hypothetical protein
MERLGVEHLEPICTTSNGPHDQAGSDRLALMGCHGADEDMRMPVTFASTSSFAQRSLFICVGDMTFSCFEATSVLRVQDVL